MQELLNRNRFSPLRAEKTCVGKSGGILPLGQTVGQLRKLNWDRSNIAQSPNLCCAFAHFRHISAQFRLSLFGLSGYAVVVLTWKARQTPDDNCAQYTLAPVPIALSCRNGRASSWATAARRAARRHELGLDLRRRVQCRHDAGQHEVEQRAPMGHLVLQSGQHFRQRRHPQFERGSRALRRRSVQRSWGRDAAAVGVGPVRHDLWLCRGEHENASMSAARLKNIGRRSGC